MSTWSFYDRQSGQLHGRVFTGPDGSVDANTPPGYVKIAGDLDALCQRVNLATGQVEEWQPPAPPDTELTTHAWDIDAKRWIGRPTLAALKLRDQAAVKAEIASIEATQPRALREAALASGSTRDAALSRLNAIDSQVKELRDVLKAIDAASDEHALAVLRVEDRLAG